jgi:predicted HAD superfamily Cof-like phosphohydrolase
MTQKFNPTELVKEFHLQFNLPIEEKPYFPNQDRIRLRYNLIQEELRELVVAIHNDSIVEVADALCDLQYVFSGTLLEFGMHSIKDSSFADFIQLNVLNDFDSLFSSIIQQNNLVGIPVPSITTPEIYGDSITRIHSDLQRIKRMVYLYEETSAITFYFLEFQKQLINIIIEFRLYGLFPKLFIEVHRSNMSKSMATEDEAKQEQASYLSNGIDCEIIPSYGRFTLIRKSDKKLIKPQSYSPANLEQFFIQISN